MLPWLISGGPRLFSVLAGALFYDVLALWAFEHLDPSQHSQCINAAADPPAGGAHFELAGTGIGRTIFDRYVHRDDFRNQAAREFRSEAATFTGRMPGAK